MPKLLPPADWTSASVNPLELLLDRENPRIAILPHDTQETIRIKLLETSEIVGLAREIIEAKGLLVGESIIACVEGNKYVVLEGNRRTTACQLLINPNLIPAAFLGKFPSAPSDVIAKLKKIKAEIAPTRVSAEITITKKHTKSSALRWTPEAQHRRIKRMLDAGNSIEEIRNLFGLKNSELVNRIKEGELLAYARSLSGWKAKEIELLHSANLQTNPFTRFFSLKGVRPLLGINFNANGVLEIEKEKRASTKKAIRFIARQFLLPGRTGKPESNTRTTPSELFKKLERADVSFKGTASKLDGEIAKPKPKPSPQGPPVKSAPQAPTKPTTRQNIFFANLSCKINDHRLISIVDEIAKIDYIQFPIAASFLSRSLLESSLLWCLKETNKERAYRQFCIEKNTRPGLHILIKFCIKSEFASTMFDDVSGVSRTLNQWLGNHKDYCDMIVHGEWLNPSRAGLDLLAADTRPFVEKVLDGSILKA